VKYATKVVVVVAKIACSHVCAYVDSSVAKWQFVAVFFGDCAKERSPSSDVRFRCSKTQ